MKDNKKWYQKISSWLLIIGSMIMVFIISINLSVMIQSKRNPDKVPTIFGYKPFIVLSGSMETEIHIGDLVITKEIDPDTLKVDDVIAFRDAEDTVTTHRIIDIVTKEGENYFVTKGDNNNTQDQNLVAYEDVEGIYKTRIPGFGTMFNTLAKPTSIIIIIVGVTAVFFVSFVVTTKKNQIKEQEEFLEYKRMKEAQEAKKKTIKKVVKKNK